MEQSCQICGYEQAAPDSRNIGQVRGNTKRFCDTDFRLWKCPSCQTIYSIDPVDFSDIYLDYPLNKRRFDAFARGTFRNLLGRLRKTGLEPNHTILDFGCGNGIFVEFLKGAGYSNVQGYDPFVPEYSTLAARDETFDYIINNDTLEHGDDVRGMLRDNLRLLKPGGRLYIGTADSEPVDMTNLEPHVMRLHQPFHRIIMTEATLAKVVSEFDVDILRTYRRSYHDTLRPFSNYRFLDELNKSLGHNLDRALDPNDATRVVMRSPRLWFFALFGYFFPAAMEPAIVVRKRAG